MPEQAAILPIGDEAKRPYTRKLRSNEHTLRRCHLFEVNGAALFVPKPEMWVFRREAKGRTPFEAIRAARKRLGADFATNTYYGWLYRYKIPWLKDWLMATGDKPDSVRVASQLEIERAAAAWDYGQHCATIGVAPDTTYTKWYAKLFRSLDWLKWLYGYPVPSGFLVIGEKLQAIRRELTLSAICVAAEVDITTVCLWKRDPKKRAAMEAICAAVKSGPGLDREILDSLEPRLRANMLCFARAARLSAACERAEFGIERYYATVREAKSLGMEDALLAYLYSRPPYQKSMSRLTGFIADRLFVPSKLMLEFRRVAGQAIVRDKLSAFTVPSALLDAWFLGWTCPRSWNDKRKADASSSPMEVAPSAASRIAPSGRQLDAPPLEQEEPSWKVRPANTAESPLYVHVVNGSGDGNPEATSAKQPKRGKAGRPREANAEKIDAECYRIHQVEEMAQKIGIRELRRLLGDNAPANWTGVRRRARRHSTEKGLPFKERS